MTHKLLLAECSDKPNCVSTQTDQVSKRMAAIAIPADFKLPQILSAIKQVTLEQPRTKLLNEGQNSLHFSFQSKWMKYIDDVEFLIDEAGREIHFRSSSRTGYSDFGVNRQRMDLLTALLKSKFNKT